MQKWEYQFVVANWENNNWRVAYLNGKEVANWKNGINLYDYSNKLGDEGWELISAPYTSVASTNQVSGHIYDTQHYYRLIFKRPKS